MSIGNIEQMAMEELMVWKARLSQERFKRALNRLDKKLDETLAELDE